MITFSPATPEPDWAALTGPAGVRGVASRADDLVGLLRRVWRAVAGLGGSSPGPAVPAHQTLTYELPLAPDSPSVDFGRPGYVRLAPRQGAGASPTRTGWQAALYSYPVRRARRTEYRFALWADRVPAASGRAIAVSRPVTVFATAKEPEVAVLAAHLVTPPAVTTRPVWRAATQYKLAALLAPRLDYATAEELFTPFMTTAPHAVTTWERVLRELALPVDVRDKVGRMLDSVTAAQMKAAHDLM